MGGSILQYLACTAYGSYYTQKTPSFYPVIEEFVKCDDKIDFILSLTNIVDLYALLYTINFREWELYNAFVTKFNKFNECKQYPGPPQVYAYLFEEPAKKIEQYKSFIFTYDYKKIKDRMDQTGIRDELTAVYYSPENIHHFSSRGDVHEGFEGRWILG